MSQPQYGRAMDRPPIAGSVKRAREQAQARLPVGQFAPPPASRLPIREEDLDSPTDVTLNRQFDPPSSRIPKPFPPAALQSKDGGIGVAISRPTQIPQWPLPGPIPSNKSQDAESYRPPPGRGPAPPRPPRPSRVPSILDSSRVQDHTPVFQYTPKSRRESIISQEGPGAPFTPSSRLTQSSLSSVGSIPDFPLPAAIPLSAIPPPPPPPPPAPPTLPAALARRSVILGPPPSSRRGASSFYSNASFVSPIPEESPRSRSHTSFASSAAIPGSWGSQSPYADEFYDDTYSTDDDDSETSRGTGSPYGEIGDESKLVRSASVGKMSKPSIVMNRGGNGGDPVPQDFPFPQEGSRPAPSPLQQKVPASPFNNGTVYVDRSSSSGTVPTVAATAATPQSLTADAMLGAVAAAGATGPAETRPWPQNRLSAIRRPPRLDMNSVREMESRGSMTSLPDMIKRATRLAALIDRGRRPASRFDMDGEWLDEKAAGREAGENEKAGVPAAAAEKHQSGLSAMLAAFPPPAATNPNPPNRGSWFRRASASSWPLAPTRGGTPVAGAAAGQPSPLGRIESNSDEGSIKRRRKCCGLPRWGFILLVVIILGIIIAAIIIPLEIFVFRKAPAGPPPPPEPAMDDCQNQLKCQNGGTNVVSQGVCSCICTNGFTGQTCTVAGAAGCTTTNLTGNSSNMDNVTLGQAIPRLLQQSQSNFSVALSGTDILAKFNTDSLSCIAQNSLVTFDGRSAREGAVLGGTPANAADVKQQGFIPFEIITLRPGDSLTITFDNLRPGGVVGPSKDIVGGFTTLTPPFRVTTIYATTSMWTTIPVPMPTQTSVPATTPPIAPPPPPETTPPATTTMSMGSLVSSAPVASPAAPPPAFQVTEQALDFARVAVLLILQRQNLMAATTAQTVLQRFFTAAGQGSRQKSGGVSLRQALNVTLGGGNSVDLVHFIINAPGGTNGTST